MNNYGLPPTYTPRLQPEYFNDTLPDSHLWQADVYRCAAILARKAGVKSIIDIGCGRAEKLIKLSSEFKTFGIDYKANIEANQQTHRNLSWYDFDLSEQVVTSAHFIGSIAICADVIEHIPYPDALIETLRNASQTAAYVLVSTPDRDRLAQGTPNGMPANKAHCREWTEAEFRAWLISEGLPVVWSGWTISYDKQPQHVNTILTILSHEPGMPDMPITFQPAQEYRKKPKTKGQALKVWMSPTPIEAYKDHTNAINTIVCRMDKHLPDYGVELVEYPDNADLLAGHAGQGSTQPIDVAHYHGLYPTAQGSDNFAVNKGVINNLRTAKEITAPSNWIADVIRRDMHINPHIIGWGVDTEEWQPGDDKHVYVLWNKARVDNVSDPTPMLELAARAHDTLFLTTFGTGTPNVKTIGRQPYEMMKSYVRNAAVYLSTNVETFGLGILEACASGVPILSFRQGAQAEYLTHGVNAFLAEPGDMEGLYAGLAYCFQHRERLGANARELAKQFTWDKVAQGFADVYRLALEPHKGAKVSVIIPCHNYEQYLSVAIESVLKQVTRFDYEVIVVLDRCTDKSAEIARSYANRGVIALTVDNGGLSATRNSGAKVASGEYLVFLDADDVLGNENFLQVLSEALDADRTLGIVFTGITVMDSEGKLGHKNAWPNGYDFDIQAQRKNQVPSCCMLRKQAWARAGGFRPFYRYTEDAEFWTTVGAIGYGAKHVVQDGWFHYRLHSNSASRVHRDGSIPEPNWLEFHPWTLDGQRPFAADGKPPRGSWPVRFYDKPEVSIIIPVGKGHEEAVKDALHSVEGQTFRMWECIVVNDTGDTLDLTGFPWAHVYDGISNGIGAGASRNRGVRLANAPFIVFLDADDMLKPHFLQATLEAYKQHGRYAYTDWLTRDDKMVYTTHETLPYSLDNFRQHPSIHPITTLLPRKWFEAVGGFDETMPAFEDVDLYLKLMVKGFCGIRVPEPLLIYNLNTGTRREFGKQAENQFKALLKTRYGAAMEVMKMCNCVEPPKGKQPLAPSQDNLSAYKDAYGDAIMSELVWERAGVGASTFFGPATRVNYGRRARHDVFLVWEQDILQSEGVFKPLNNYTTEPEVTVIPEPPPVAFERVPIEQIASVMATMQGLDEHIIEGNKPEAETVTSTLYTGDEIVEQVVTAMKRVPEKPRGKPGRKAKRQ